MDRELIIRRKKESSPTSKFLLEYFPEGSVVDRRGIQMLYEKHSTSKGRDKKAKSHTGSGKFSVRLTRRRRGASLFKKLVKIGYWKSTAH